MSIQKPLTVPFTDFDLQYQSMSDEILEAIQSVLVKGDLVLREPVANFENEFANFIGVKHVVGMSNCSDALRLSLLACGVGPGDEVITVAHTFVATVAAIVQTGATPILVDIREDYNIDVSVIEAALTPRTKVLVPVHLNGRMCDMSAIMDIATRHHLIVIEDSAQAIGSRFAGKPAGTFGSAGCFSFFPGKILGALGDAGAVATNDDELARKLRLLRDHGRASRADVDCWGYNCRLDALQAAVLSVKLKHVPEWVSTRRCLASRYHEGLSTCSDLTLPPAPSNDTEYFDAYQSYVIGSTAQTALSSFLLTRGIEALIYWAKPLHHQPNLGLAHFRLPKTEAASQTVVSVPLHANLTLTEVDYVIRNIQEFHSTNQSLFQQRQTHWGVSKSF